MNTHPWLRPLALSGGGILPNRIVPGPMEGVSEGSFVTVMTRAGLVRSWFTPFIRVSNGVPRTAKLREKTSRFLGTGLPVIAQVMGTRTEFLAETAGRLHRLGVACVDLNCACPSPKVVANHSGGYRLNDPQWLYDTIIAMKNAADGAAVSIKIRCGFQTPDEMPSIAAAIASAAPDIVFCHFRTVQEHYAPIRDGHARLARMRELLPNLTLFGSGDLFTPQDAQSMLRDCNVDGIAPARGLLKNPALIRLIEADCGGEPFVSPFQSTRQLIDFLNEVGSESGQARKHQGFILKIAKVMFGEQSDDFRTLMKEIQQRP